MNVMDALLNFNRLILLNPFRDQPPRLFGQIGLVPQPDVFIPL
jgi:hypothetical protein